jgi:hypothetical protein
MGLFPFAQLKDEYARVAARRDIDEWRRTL